MAWLAYALFLMYSKPCIFACVCFSAVSNPNISLKAQLRSWWYFSFSTSSKFLEGVPKWSAKFTNRSRVGCIVCTVRSPRGFLILSPVLQPSERSYDGTSFRLMIISKLPIFLMVFQISLKDWSATASNIPGSLLPHFCFPCLVTEKVLSGCFLYLQRGFSVSVFPHVMRGGEDNIELIEEIVSTVLMVFHYWLTLSHSDFLKCRTG